MQKIRKLIRENYVLAAVALLYLLMAFIGTNGYALYAGDSASHIVQANYIKENPDRIFGWSDIAYNGYPLLFFYQPLPHLILAILFNFGNIFLIYKSVLIMLFTLIPFSFYFCSRKLGFRKEVCELVAFLPLSVSSFTGFGIEAASIFSWGLFTQLTGVVLFPLLIGLLYSDKIDSLKSFFLFSLIILCHSIITIIAVISGSIILAAKFSRKRMVAFLKVFVYSLAFTGFWWIPLLIYKGAYGGIMKSKEYLYSFGFFKVFTSFISGRTLDTGRIFPILTILALVGIFVSFRKNKFVFFGFIASFILFSGGKFLSHLPVLELIELHRFIFMFHFFSILLIGFAYSAFFRNKLHLVAMALILVFSVPVIAEAYSRQQTINSYENLQDVHAIEEIGKFLHDKEEGRAYLEGVRFEPAVSLFYYHSSKPVIDKFSLGSQDSYSAKYSNIESFDEYNIKYLITNKTYDLPGKRFNDFNLYFTNATGYFSLEKGCGNVSGVGKYSALLSLNRSCNMTYKASYFPLWGAGRQLKIIPSSKGLMNVEAGKDTKKVEFIYKDVWYRKYLLLAALLLVIFSKKIVCPNPKKVKKHA